MALAGLLGPTIERFKTMDYIVSNIVWDADVWANNLPDEMFVSWCNGCESREEAIDFVSDFYSYCIISCDVREE